MAPNLDNVYVLIEFAEEQVAENMGEKKSTCSSTARPLTKPISPGARDLLDYCVRGGGSKPAGGFYRGLAGAMMEGVLPLSLKNSEALVSE